MSSEVSLDRATLLKRLKKEQNFKITKPTVTAPKLLDIIFHRSRQSRSIYNFTTGRKLDPEVLKNLEKQKTACYFPPVTPGVTYSALKRIERENQRLKEKNMSVTEKPTRRTRQMHHLAERLYVPQNEISDVLKSKIKVLDHYFAVTEGNPIKDKFSVRNYVNEVRESLLTKLKTGFLQDEVYLIEEQYRNEKRRISALTELYKNYYNSFKEFMAQDHEEWVMIRRKADEMALETSNKRSELKQLMKELSQIKGSLYELEEKWRNCKLCQIFLFQISPLSWQEAHPLETKDGNDITINDMFDRYKLDTEGSVQSLNDLIEIFQEDIAVTKGPPELYFTDPWQVRLVFREMELQNLSSLLIIEAIRKPKDVMLQGLQAIKTYYDGEIMSIEEQLEISEKQTQLEEQHVAELKNFAMGLYHNDLKEVVSSESTILTHLYLEHAYEECVATGNPDMTPIQTLQALKLLYEDLMMKLDSLPFEIVKEAENDVHNRDVLALEKAHRARKQVAILDNLTKSMKRALDKPYVRYGRPLMRRSKPPSPKPRPKPLAEEYSQTELEYLTHFTDYCKYDDEEAVKLFFSLGT